MQLEIDRTYGGVYAGTSIEFSPAMAGHLNAAAGRARGLLDDEFVPFAPLEAVSVACPTRSLPRADFIAAYRRLRVVVDGGRDGLDLRLAEHPHFFSADPDEPGRLRGVPTYLPKTLFPPDFFGRPHQVELRDDGVRVAGPVERFFHDAQSGALFHHVEDAPGGIVLEVRGNLDVLARRGEILFFTDPAFGAPRAVTVLRDDGASVPLEWRMLGRNRIADVELFDEWVATGIEPRGDRLVIEVRLPNRGTGVAGALYAGHTRDTALRPDASVL